MFVVRSLVAAAVAALLVLAPGRAEAQSPQSDPVSTKGKGIAGGALLGGEAVLITEAALDVKAGWAYLVGGLVGGAAGGVGGYYAEQTDDAKLSLYLLAGGMALAIPTTVAVLSATAYEPPTDYTADEGPVDEPVANPPQPADEPEAQPSAPPPAPTPPEPAPEPTSQRLELQRPTLLPPSLLGIREGYVSLSVPAVEIRDVFSRRELYEFGLRQQTEVRFSVFSAVF